jgi:ATP-dependent Clp protease protease subunit
MKKGKDTSEKLLTMAANGTAEVFMYGIFGESQDWMTETEAAKYMSDLDFMVSMRTLAKDNGRINYRINSPGGSMKHGLAMITAVKSATVDVHCYIDGLAASMAADFFLAFKKENRHMASNAVLMIHCPIDGVYGNAKAHDECSVKLRQLAKPTITLLADAMQKSDDEVEALFYDFTDHYLTAKECFDLGIIAEIENYEAAQTVAEPQKLAYSDLLNVFTHRSDTAKIVHPHYFNHEKEDSDMTTDDISKALADGKLDKAALFAALNVVEKVVEVPPTPPVLDFQKMVQDAVKAAIGPIQAANIELTNKITELGKRTEGPTMLLSSGDIHGEQDDLVKLFEERQNALAKESTPFTRSY